MTALPMHRQPMTAAEYAALPVDEDERYELQEGFRVMSPRPILDHQDGVSLLRDQLLRQLPRDLKILLDVDVDLQLVPPHRPGTVRAPDLVVVTREAFKRVRAERGFLRASEVVLVVEFVSPGGERRDTRVKHDEYADAGIGHYWMIELTDGPSLTACHLGGDLGYVNAPLVRSEFTTADPFPIRVDLAALVDD